MARPNLRQALAGTIAGLARDVRRLRFRFRLYPSWQEAAQDASYEDSDLIDYRAQKAALFIRDGHQEGLNTPGLNHLRLCTRWLMAQGRPVRILDFGGSFGEEGLALLSDPALSDRAEYIVCESPAVCRRSASLPLPDGLTFTDDLSSVEGCDIFYSSAALPYVEDNKAILDMAIGLSPQFIILVRNCFSETELIRIQESPLFHNGPQIGEVGDFRNRTVHYPHHTQNMALTVERLRDGGYSLVSNFAEESGVYPYGDEVFGRDLIFVRDDPTTGASRPFS